ncbi:MAG: hypothetical protein ABFC34_17250 [Methanobacterium sp.]
MVQQSWDKQISNKSFLSPTGFKFSLAKKPKIDFFCDSANIPGISLGVAMQPTYLKNIPVPGDVLSFDDLVISFNIDEDMENYLEIHNWLYQFGFPRDAGQYQQLLDEDENSEGKQTAISGMSDGTLIVYSSNYRPNIQVNFKDLFPVSLTPVKFESKVNDVQYLTADAVFKYTIYEIVKIQD